MHVVSDLQRRPNKGRLKSEQHMMFLHDIVTIVQIVCFLIYTTNFLIASRRTFVHSVWLPNPLQLVPALIVKTRECRFEVTKSNLYAFRDVHLVLSLQNSDDIFADHAIQMLLAIFFCGSALLFGVLNRSLVEHNFFSVSWRNFTLRKDIFSAFEIVMISLVLRTSLMANVSGGLLKEYLTHCGVVSDAYLPFCSLVPLFLFVSVGYFVYLFGTVVYLCNALPKYGIMSEAEIAEYKIWLRNRQERVREAKRAAEEAKRANMLLQHVMRLESLPPIIRPTPPPPSHSVPTHHDMSLRHDTEATPPLDLSASNYTSTINMPRRRDTASQRQAATGASRKSVHAPMYASYINVQTSHSSRN
ncbi:hypothetical protein MOQ_007283 [Trypanosoma cruzi marinkellei]|uniref:Uncharacterized protein n=1 Tax=Trypanosoma cruzi marinkellei TaxID=85056 RepID=K2MPA9_TRYCR|nr:hypothetical protein MOQ_007283 [Trypanosoma cruzi marinkellei]